MTEVRWNSDECLLLSFVSLPFLNSGRVVLKPTFPSLLIFALIYPQVVH